MNAPVGWRRGPVLPVVAHVLARLHAPIPGFPGYWITLDGRVFSTRKRGMGSRLRLAYLSQRRHPRTGHLRVDLRDDAEIKRTLGVHLLVLRAWVGPAPPEAEQACHLDGDPTHNHVDNLYWGSPAENAADREYHARARADAEVARVSAQPLPADYVYSPDPDVGF